MHEDRFDPNNDQETKMATRHLLLFTLILPLMAAAQDTASNIAAVGKVIDDFHDAAAHGDKDRYLGLLTENAVFMGTDEWGVGRSTPISASMSIVVSTTVPAGTTNRSNGPCALASDPTLPGSMRSCIQRRTGAFVARAC